MDASVFPLPKHIEDAFVLMEINQPPYPTKLIEQLGAYQGNGHGVHWHQQARPCFKGWIGTVDDKTRYSAEMGNYPEDLTNISYVGLWCGVTALKFVIYCAIPSMLTGQAQPGQTIEMGKRLRIGHNTQDEIDGFVVEGWSKMQDMIREYGEYIPTFKANGIERA